MPDVGSTDLRLFLHVPAAAIWVGGQLVLAARARTRRTSAWSGASTGATALLALFLGAVLHG
jgi:putative copper export protein